MAVAQARKLNHLGAALTSRDVIGQAKGVLMERYKITAVQAFAVLARTSQDANRKLYEVTEHLTQTGLLAPESRRGSSTATPPAPAGRPDRQDAP